jgi:hypothetical protein
MVETKKGFRLPPQAYIERLKARPVLIGHERCAASQFGTDGTFMMCSVHSYTVAQNILSRGRYYLGCRECIETQCQVTAARTEPKPRSIYVDVTEGQMD